METKELRKEINQKLKELGLKRKDYSLNIRSSGYADTYIRCTIKNPYICIEEVEKILNKYNDIDRDQGTYEILQGCNTFVIVQYDYGIFEEVSKEYITEAQNMIDKIKNIGNHNGLIFHVGNYNVSLGNENGKKTLAIYDTKMDRFGSIKWISNINDLAVWLFKLHNYKAMAY